jgi:hypothetical protein
VVRIAKFAIVLITAFLLITTIFVVSSSISTALGVSTPYLENNTLEVVPGNNYTFIINIQNGDSQDYYVNIAHKTSDRFGTLQGKKDIIRISNNTLFVSAKTYNTKNTFYISIPSNTSIGREYIVEYSVKPIAESNVSSTLVNTSVNRSLKIRVIEDKSQNNNTNQTNKWNSKIKYVGIGLLILILTAGLLFVSNRLWKVSKGVATEINNHSFSSTKSIGNTSTSKEKHTEYTIMQAVNTQEILTLLEKIDKEEYAVPEIKKIFKEKILEVTRNKISEKDIDNLSRARLIKELKKLHNKKRIKN